MEACAGYDDNLLDFCFLYKVLHAETSIVSVYAVLNYCFIHQTHSAY